MQKYFNHILFNPPILITDYIKFMDGEWDIFREFLRKFKNFIKINFPK